MQTEIPCCAKPVTNAIQMTKKMMPIKRLYWADAKKLQTSMSDTKDVVLRDSNGIELQAGKPTQDLPKSKDDQIKAPFVH